MPPAQCPECGRFLKRTLVDSLAEAPAPCPKCGVELIEAMFVDVTPSAAPARPAAAEPAAAAPLESSVRPPDLPPEEVRGGPDPLAGWDAGVALDGAAIRDEPPFPVDTMVVAGAAVVGAALGATFGRRPLRDGALGAVGGAVGAGLTRRIWQLP